MKKGEKGATDELGECNCMNCRMARLEGTLDKLSKQIAQLIEMEKEGKK